jgi:hypothetical protein
MEWYVNEICEPFFEQLTLEERNLHTFRKIMHRHTPEKILRRRNALHLMNEKSAEE